MDIKKQIVDDVRQMGELYAEVDDHWLKVQRSLAEDRVDDAISLLNAYFRLKDKLVGVESRLKGTLKASFSDK